MRVGHRYVSLLTGWMMGKRGTNLSNACTDPQMGQLNECDCSVDDRAKSDHRSVKVMKKCMSGEE